MISSSSSSSSLLSSSRSTILRHNNNITNNNSNGRKSLSVLLASIFLTFDISSSSALAATASASALQSTLQSLDVRYFIAGGTCAAISHGITTPIDVIKTRIQANPKKYNRGIRNAALDILNEDGPKALLGGLGPTVVGYGIEGALKFGVYEVMKPIVSNLLASLTSSTSPAATVAAAATAAVANASNSNISGAAAAAAAAVAAGGGNAGPKAQTSAVAFLLASMVAGAIASLVLCPMESTRIRIVTDPEYADKGLLSGLPKLINEEGLLSSFGGLYAMLAKQVPYTFGKQVSFDVFAGMLYTFFQSMHSISDVTVRWIVSITAAFLASIVACIFSQPGDMILTETYRRTSSSTSSTSKRQQQASSSSSFIDVISRIYNENNGMKGFFTGTGTRIIHVGLIITSQLVIYDIVKQLLGLPATGATKH